MRRHALVSIATIASALALGCSDQLGPTESSAGTSSPAPEAPLAAAKARFHFPFTGELGLSFTNPCTGALVEGTGEVVGQINVVGEDLGGVIAGLHVEVLENLTGTLTDASNGTTYTFRDVSHDSFNSPSLEALNFTSTHSGTVVAFPTDGTGAAFVSHVTFHTTVGPNGVEKVALEFFNSKCLS